MTRPSFTRPAAGRAKRLGSTLAAVLFLMVLALEVRAEPAVAAIFNPTRTDDPPPNGCAPTDCSLREAVMAADAAGGLDFIQLGSSVYQLSIATPGGQQDASTNGDLDVTDTSDLFVLGAGAGQTIIDGGHVDRIFDINAGARLSIWSVEIRNGDAKVGFFNHAHGGGIHNHGYLGLFWSTLTTNYSAPDAPWGGGGLTNAGGAVAELSDVTIASNLTATGCGGGIENGGTLKAWNLTVIGNNAGPGKGPGIAGGTGTPAGRGCFFGGGTVRLNNTVVAAQNYENCLGTMTSLGHNIASDGTCGLSAVGDRVLGSLALSPLTDPAGYVWLYTPLPGSPVIDAGSGPYEAATETGCSPVDQVGTARPQDGDGDGQAVCDIGAYEAPPPEPTPTPTATATPTPSATPTPTPTATPVPRRPARLRVTRAYVTRRVLVVTGRLDPGATGTVRATLRIPMARHRVRVARSRAVVHRGRFSIRHRLPRRIARRARVAVTLRYGGNRTIRPAEIRRRVMVARR